VRIIEAAHVMFWRHGFVRASLDDIAAQAGITKRTLYQHFRSKDDLMAAVLLQASELSVARLRRYFEQPYATPIALLEAIFSDMAQWAAKPRWMGAGFTRVAIELADLPGHPARAVAQRHKQTVERHLAQLLERAGVPDVEDRAREIMLLWEGALTLTLIHADRRYIGAAAEAAKRLVAGAGVALSRPPEPAAGDRAAAVRR